MPSKKINELLGDKADYLLSYQSKTISKDQLHLPGPDFVDRMWINSDRNPQVLRNLQSMYNNGRLSNTGYLSILPVDQVLNIAPELRLLKIQFTSIRKI
jgi:class I fructose-bisphosphate aldolase